MPDVKLVNGSRGVVVGFESTLVADEFGVPPGKYTCPVVSFDSGQRLAIKPCSFFQPGGGGAVVRVAVPIKLAWALTVRSCFRDHGSEFSLIARGDFIVWGLRARATVEDFQCAFAPHRNRESWLARARCRSGRCQVTGDVALARRARVD